VLENRTLARDIFSATITPGEGPPGVIVERA
jgi:hypothetical protein